jgi:hypothetical protein
MTKQNKLPCFIDRYLNPKNIVKFRHGRRRRFRE